MNKRQQIRKVLENLESVTQLTILSYKVDRRTKGVIRVRVHLNNPIKEEVLKSSFLSSKSTLRVSRLQSDSLTLYLKDGKRVSTRVRSRLTVLVKKGSAYRPLQPGDVISVSKYSKSISKVLTVLKVYIDRVVVAIGTRGRMVVSVDNLINSELGLCH